MRVEEVTQRIQSLYSKGAQSRDSRLTSRHIYNKMLTVRSKLVSQEAKKHQRVNQWNYQTLECVEMIKALPYECPCLPPVGCEIYRTKEKLPKPLTDLDSHLLQSVTSVEGSITYSEISWNEKKYKQHDKYASNKPDYYIRNEYLYITTTKGPSAISITGLFEDPWVVESYPTTCDTEGSTVNCTSPLDMDFPLDADMIDVLVEMAVLELVAAFSQGIEDKSNNSSDDIERKQRDRTYAPYRRRPPE